MSGPGREDRPGGPSREERRERRAGRPRPRGAQRPAERARTGDPARRVAYDVMRAIDGGAYANLELPRALHRAGLTGRDAAFATELVYGATRLRGRYDPIVARCAGRDLAAIDADVLDVLRLGAHQCLGMRVRRHAAVGETVALAREVLGAGAAGFVNAVLRRVSEKDPEAWLDVVAGDAGNAGDADDALAVRHSHPAWIVRALRSALLGHGAVSEDGVEADLVALLEADNTPAPVALVARPGLADVDELLEAGATPSTLSPVGAVLDSGDPGALPAVRDARAAVQDEGSQLLPLALLAADEPGPGERWLDLCAGPGGKAGLLAALARRHDATLFCNEPSEHRADLVHQAVRAAVEAGADVFVGVGDGRDLGREEPDAFDRVLVDAPCTGLGALRRRPEARWRRTPDDVGALAGLQSELLDAALEATRPGGLVAYATCSPHLAETRAVVDDALRRHPDARELDARPFLRDAAGAALEGLGAGPSAQLWPHVHGTDAMFLSLLRRDGPGR